MRLADDERSAIRNAIAQSDAQAQVYIFGSRVDDAAKGGDIDVLVLSKKINLMAKLDILARLHHALGQRKIDIAVFPDTTHPFPRLVIQDAVLI